MSITQSPFSGEFGYGSSGSQAVRLLKSEYVPLDSILVDRSQLPATPLESWGFESLATRDEAVQVPELILASDLSSRYDVDFLDGRKRVGGFVFDDRHPDQWWDAVHEEHRLLILVGDVTAFVQAKTNREQLDVIRNTHYGLSPLVIRAYESGVGTAAPGQ